MKKVSSFKRVVRFSTVPLLLLTLAVFASPAYASTSVKEKEATNSIVGTWNTSVYFLSGSHAGETSNPQITFTSDGALTILTIAGNATISGTGTWSQITPSLVTYSYTETINVGGQIIALIHATAYVVLTDQGNSFIGSGAATITNPDGTPLDQATEAITAQRATA